MRLAKIKSEYTKFGEKMDQWEHTYLYIAGGSTNWYSQFGKQFGIIS